MFISRLSKEVNLIRSLSVTVAIFSTFQLCFVQGGDNPKCEGYLSQHSFLTEEEKLAIIKAHNVRRNEAARECYHDPIHCSSSRRSNRGVTKIMWDDELASLAQSLAESCLKLNEVITEVRIDKSHNSAVEEITKFEMAYILVENGNGEQVRRLFTESIPTIFAYGNRESIFSRRGPDMSLGFNDASEHDLSRMDADVFGCGFVLRRVKAYVAYHLVCSYDILSKSVRDILSNTTEHRAFSVTDQDKCRPCSERTQRCDQEFEYLCTTREFGNRIDDEKTWFRLPRENQSRMFPEVDELIQKLKASLPYLLPAFFCAAVFGFAVEMTLLICEYWEQLSKPTLKQLYDSLTEEEKELYDLLVEHGDIESEVLIMDVKIMARILREDREALEMGQARIRFLARRKKRNKRNSKARASRSIKRNKIRKKNHSKRVTGKQKTA